MKEQYTVSKKRRVEHARKQDAARALLDLFNTALVMGLYTVSLTLEPLHK